MGFGALGSTGATLPVTLGMCAWKDATADGTLFPPTPPYTPAPNDKNTNLPILTPGKVVGVMAHDAKNDGVDKCGADKNGKYYPGGFGWVQDNDGTLDCNVTFSSTGIVILAGSNGAAPPNGCKDDSLWDRVGTEVYLPVFGAVSGGGYEIVGLASFFFAGFQDIPTAKPNKTSSKYKVPSPNPCGSSNTDCLWGWFTKPLVPVGSFGSGTNLGPVSLGLLG